MRLLTRLALLGAVAASALTAASSASPMGAFVLKTTCFFAPGDIPGMPFFVVPHGQVVITPSGGFHLTCHGSLPAGFSVLETMKINLPCDSPEFPNARGQIIVTKSGQVNAVCHAGP